MNIYHTDRQILGGEAIKLFGEKLIGCRVRVTGYPQLGSKNDHGTITNYQTADKGGKIKIEMDAGGMVEIDANCSPSYRRWSEPNSFYTEMKKWDNDRTKEY